MKPSQIGLLLERTTELKHLFLVGQRAIPFLEEVFSFLSEISPLMNEIDASLRDTTSKMPHASNQIFNVSQATELATTEILDLVDAALRSLSVLQEDVLRHAADEAEGAQVGQALLPELAAALAGRQDDLLARTEACFQEAQRVRGEQALVRARSTDEMHIVRRRLNEIMLALQVQDITSQQLAAVNHLIESVRARMALLTSRLSSEAETSDAASAFGDDTMTFNPAARFTPTGSHQNVADEAMQGFLGASDGSSALIEEPAAPEELQPNAERDIPTSEEQAAASGDGATDKGPASQEEIDALFRSAFGG